MIYFPANYIISSMAEVAYITRLSPRRPGFNPRPVGVGFVVDEVASSLSSSSLNSINPLQGLRDLPDIELVTYSISQCNKFNTEQQLR
jgi:hypothetical protein